MSNPIAARLASWPITALLLLIQLCPVVASAQTAIALLEPACRKLSSPPYVVRLGYTTFERPEIVRTDSTLHALAQYLREVARLSECEGGPWKRPVQFDVTLGNYYQVWAWFRTRQIDAAVVSPFVAMLLERETRALSVVEFSESDKNTRGGHVPFIAASGAALKQPVEGFEQYLGELLKVAELGSVTSTASIKEMKKLRGSYRVNMVAHLSSSGFVVPALFVDGWLGKKNVTQDTQARFWHLFFENMHLRLAHGGATAQKAPTEFLFSYGGRSPTSLERERQEQGLGKWTSYHIAPFREGAPIIPNDVLIVRREVAAEIVGAENMDRTVLGGLLTSGPMQRSFTGGSYSGVRWFSDSVHALFRREADRLFGAGSAALGPRHERWFHHGRFDFTAAETLAFLRQDQETTDSARLSLVLSGGGVKSLYQTVLLDHLYGRNGEEPQIRNYDEGTSSHVGPTHKNSNGPLTVHTIIGTSGGAMLAFFAAQLPELTTTAATLTAVLSKTAERPLFPSVDIARVASVMLLLALLVGMGALVRAFNLFGYGNSSDIITKNSLRWSGVVGGLVLALGALLIVITRSDHIESMPLAEGTLFGLTALAAHFGITCIARRDRTQPVLPGQRRLGLLTVAFGAQLIAICVAGRFALESSPLRSDAADSMPLSLAASIGLFCTVIGFIAAAAAGLNQWRLDRTREYGLGLAAAIIVVVIAYVPVLLLAAPGWVPTLELTGLFWLALGLSGIATALFLLGWASHTPAREGFVALICNRRGGLTTTLGGTLLATAAWSLSMWLLIVAPGLYGNAEAFTAFSETLTPEEMQSNRFRTNLVVTASLLDDADCGAERVPAGGLYFCFEGVEGCGVTERGHWQVFRRPIVGRALDAVFASGSAFPVLPAHRAHLANGCAVALVDGGYAHNVPLEAAAMADSKQVLILNASPDMSDALPLEVPWWRRTLHQFRIRRSKLADHSGNLLSFMFDRAQELDRNIGSSMVVASLTPRPENPHLWPFLLNFQPSVRKLMIETAQADLDDDRRIGHVISWGSPTSLFRIDAGPTQLAPAPGWSKATHDRLEMLRGLKWTGNNAPVAAFDLDNTCLQGDIGEAMFLKMVAELRYNGGDKGFWELIPDARAREILKEYWNRFNGPSRRVYTKPYEWSGDFTDYVVLFMRQYDHLKAAQGNRVAYAWVVQLLAGMPPETAEQMAQELWAEEMRRSVLPVTVRSPKYGELKIEGGVRVRQEFRQLIEEFQKKGWQVWIVSASNRFAVRTVASVLGVQPDRVIAMTPTTANGILTSDLEQPLPYGPGKRDALKNRGLRPLLAAGDSMTDVEMLQMADTVILVDRGNIDKKLIGPHWLLEKPSTFRLETRQLQEQ